MSTGEFNGRLDQIQPPTQKVWDATGDRTDCDEVSDRLYRLKQAWQKNKFKPTTRMEYLMRRVRGMWRRLVFRLQVIGDRWNGYMQSEIALIIICGMLLTFCMVVGFILGISFPD